MGRHRSTLRELGWGVSNSPNPWKQGSAKRVVRTLDYSQAELDEPAAAPAPAAAAADIDERLTQLQQDGRQQLDRIREQFEVQDVDSRRKLERLNGRIAELGEGKRSHMWSVLGQYQKGGKADDAGSEWNAAPPVPRPIERDDCASREAELAEKAAALEKAEAAATAKAAAAQQAVAKREVAVSEREAAASAREATLRQGEAALAAAKEQLVTREASLQQRLTALAAREQAVASAEAAAARRQATTAAAPSVAPEAAADASGAAHEGAAGGRSGMVATELVAEGTEGAHAGGVAGEGAAASAASAAADDSRAPSGKVRFHENGAAANAAASSSSAAPPPAAAGGAKPTAAAAKEAAKGAGAKAKTEDGREIVCDATADWIRAENLTASLVRQRSDNPDDVFFPLPHQRTCELADIFSAPRRRERAKGSGEWSVTPADGAEAGAAGGAASAAEAPAEKVAPPPQNTLQLLGVEGEYMGEQIGLPLVLGSASTALTILVGRSSACEVTLSRDDQISRRHLQLETRDGRLYARDLGSTYGTRLNGQSLGAEPAEVLPGDVLVIGASSFQLQRPSPS